MGNTKENAIPDMVMYEMDGVEGEQWQMWSYV